jgi:hypothetical protein
VAPGGFHWQVSHLLERQLASLHHRLPACDASTEEGFIGELAAHAYTFMGGIYSTRRVRGELMPRITQALLAEKADLALLVPV